MAAKRDENDGPNGAPEKTVQSTEAQGERRRKGRVITAKDAGWVTPTAFVLPIKLVPVDPPRLIKKKSPAG
ncbi:MAG TPA: hypothetical protein VNH11_34880 [Pirellulales bacterium]|nr:hypothetical protein [Pirellulales bacterium]